MKIETYKNNVLIETEEISDIELSPSCIEYRIKKLEIDQKAIATKIGL